MCCGFWVNVVVVDWCKNCLKCFFFFFPLPAFFSPPPTPHPPPLVFFSPTAPRSLWNFFFSLGVVCVFCFLGAVSKPTPGFFFLFPPPPLFPCSPLFFPPPPMFSLYPLAFFSFFFFFFLPPPPPLSPFFFLFYLPPPHLVFFFLLFVCFVSPLFFFFVLCSPLCSFVCFLFPPMFFFCGLVVSLDVCLPLLPPPSPFFCFATNAKESISGVTTHVCAHRSYHLRLPAWAFPPSLRLRPPQPRQSLIVARAERFRQIPQFCLSPWPAPKTAAPPHALKPAHVLPVRNNLCNFTAGGVRRRQKRIYAPLCLASWRYVAATFFAGVRAHSLALIYRGPA